jgi:hypothetical protein
MVGFFKVVLLFVDRKNGRPKAPDKHDGRISHRAEQLRFIIKASQTITD